jgi:hypothetical protein
MLEYMGAWEWYDRQIKLTMAKHEAEKKKELAPKTVASYVLSDLQKLKTPGKSKEGSAPVVFGNSPFGHPLGFVCWFPPTVERDEYLSHIRATVCPPVLSLLHSIAMSRQLEINTEAPSSGSTTVGSFLITLTL